MEAKVKRPRGRPRKRKRPEDEDVTDSAEGKRHSVVVEAKPIALVGRYVLKEFEGGIFLGKIVYYDSGLYRVNYEDGDCEDLESSELRQFLLSENDFDTGLSRRRRKLDGWLVKKSVKNDKDGLEKKDGDAKSEVNRVEVSTLSEVCCGLTVEDGGEEVEGDMDSSSDSCQYVQEIDAGFQAETLLVPPPQLPPSSGTIGMPDEYVSHLFSVYGFLRSFGIHLFLSPFGLDDFVGSLNCCVPNTLLDAIHVALMRILRRHLETLSSDGSELASNCFRCIDWSLLDTITWPVYVVQYLASMGYIKGTQWTGFYDEVSDREYYSLSAGRKLMILQILCDDVLDSDELRAEIDIREETEVGIDPDAALSDGPEIAPRRVHPRFSKTSACKNMEAFEIISGNDQMKPICTAKPLGFKRTDGETDVSGVHVDGNGDECRICGMDGTLLCCDGCPSAYHTRCIGVSKMYIPQGSWYCPECLVNQVGPTVTIGTSLRGAELFGIDLYGQVFLGTGSYLLVLNVSSHMEQYIRYYNVIDIPKVFSALLSSVQHVSLYSGICKAVLKFWDIPESVVPPMGIKTNVTNMKTDEKLCSQSHHPPVNESHRTTGMAEAVNTSSNNGSNVDSAAVSSVHNMMSQTDVRLTQNTAISITEKSHGSLVLTGKLPELIKTECAISTGSVSQQTDPSEVTYQSLVDRSNAANFKTCPSKISENCNSGHPSSCFSENMSFLSKEGSHAGLLGVETNSANKCAVTGSVFKPQAYINQYMHGEFAAAAASKLAIISSEESQVSETHKPGNARKAMSGSISLLAKAFSLTASRFFWPYSERKLWEVPRERCSWCYSCKSPPSNRRGCMLNSAMTVATKSATKILNSLITPKTGEGNLSIIAVYILYMEESLCGLVGGPFRSVSYRNKWRKQVAEAFTFNSIKALLLKLEENICQIALSGDWIKSMDDWLGDSSVIQSASCNFVGTQKRGLSGKRGRKHSGVSVATADDFNDQSFSWWQGGKSSKLISKKAVLPIAMIRNAARRGGARKISGVNYAAEVPKRSRQLVWRAAVERSKTVSQLALQVRCVDLHIRWSELVRPEQNVQDGKGLETEASAFRNAIICDKKYAETKIIYGVSFGLHRHLPSRVMKNIIDIEQSQDGKRKYWFPEICIPLYLIKEYEESVDKVIVPPSKKFSNELSQFQKKQLKASRQDVFVYLVGKRDKVEKCACASCQLDVLLGNAVKCSACQGYCHGGCTASSVHMHSRVESLIICNRCYHPRPPVPSELSSESPTSPLPSHRQGFHTATKVSKGTRPKGLNQSLVSVRTSESSEIKKAVSDSSVGIKTRNRTLSWGVIWRKKNTEDVGADFRHKNVLPRGSSVINLEPVCDLCKQPYDSSLMYIHCETCQRWFHADAVELEESKLSEVVGFKCCRCRRIGGPECPYMDPELKEQKLKKRLLRAPKHGKGSNKVYSDRGTISESKECKPAARMHFPREETFVPEDDPLLFSLSTVERITEPPCSEVECGWNSAVRGPQKLPVRRQMKCEEDVGGGSIGDNVPTVDSSVSFDANYVMNPKEELSVPCADWDASGNDLEGNMLFDYDGLNFEDMEYEPQTYFSLSELLASDDGQLDGIGAAGVVLGNQVDVSCSTQRNEAQWGLGLSNDQSESAVHKMQCQMCPDVEPGPDLSCEICGLMIHGRCSPWVESSQLEAGWKCGNCREWR